MARKLSSACRTMRSAVKCAEKRYLRVLETSTLEELKEAVSDPVAFFESALSVGGPAARKMPRRAPGRYFVMLN